MQNSLLKRRKLHVLGAATGALAVAVCVAEVISVAVLDGGSICGHEWSVAKSFKLVRPYLPIIPLEERARRSTLPEGVDVVVPLFAPKELLDNIERFLKRKNNLQTIGQLR